MQKARGDQSRSRRFRNSPANAVAEDEECVRPLITAKGRSGSLRRWYQSMTQKLREHRKPRHSPHHPHHHHLAPRHPNDSIRVTIPMRMMFSTLAVFLILPLTMFVWKEVHMSPSTAETLDKPGQLRGNEQSSFGEQHDKFPTWMDETGAKILSPQETTKTKSNTATQSQSKEEEEEKVATGEDDPSAKMKMESGDQQESSSSLVGAVLHNETVVESKITDAEQTESHSKQSTSNQHQDESKPSSDKSLSKKTTDQGTTEQHLESPASPEENPGAVEHEQLSLPDSREEAELVIEQESSPQIADANAMEINAPASNGELHDSVPTP